MLISWDLFISDDSLLFEVNAIIRKKYGYLLSLSYSAPVKPEASHPSFCLPTQALSTSNHLSFLLSLPPFNLLKVVQYLAQLKNTIPLAAGVRVFGAK